MQEALIVRREQQIAAPPAAVFALLTDPEKILRELGLSRDEIADLCQREVVGKESGLSAAA